MSETVRQVVDAVVANRERFEAFCRSLTDEQLAALDASHRQCEDRSAVFPRQSERSHVMASSELKSMGKPDETRKFEHGQIEVVNIGDGTVGRATFEPGWKWSSHVKPIAGTDFCEAPHFMYQLSGRMHVEMKDGKTIEVGPGDVALIPPGHDAWVVGNEKVVAVDWSGAANYAKR